MVKQGFVYACSHETWLQETIRSALSVKEIMPDVERELYITEDLFIATKSILEGTFTRVVSLHKTAFKHRPRFESFLLTSLDKAIFIDGDTFILEPCYELFQVLDDFDIALCIAPQLHHHRAIEMDLHSFLPSVSMAIAEFNGGLIVANNTEKFRVFVKYWMQLFEICLSQRYGMDQASLRVALAKSNLRIATLPNNYNFRAHICQSTAGTVKILHCHGEIDQIAKTINQEKTIRLHTPPNQFILGKRPIGRP